jgi:hypothetical protein
VGLLVPRQWIGALQDVAVKELAKLEVWPDGSAIEIEDRDIQISVHGLLTAGQFRGYRCPASQWQFLAASH